MKFFDENLFICFQICKTKSKKEKYLFAFKFAKKTTQKRESLIAFKLLGKTKSIFDEWKSKEHVSLKKKEVLNNFGAKCRIGGLIL